MMNQCVEIRMPTGKRYILGKVGNFAFQWVTNAWDHILHMNWRGGGEEMLNSNGTNLTLSKNDHS